MKRDPSLIRLSRDHHRGLVLALRIERDLPAMDDAALERLRLDTIEFWRNGLLPHFRAECECILTRLVRHVSPQDTLIARTQADHLHLNALLTSLVETTDAASCRRLLSEAGALLKDHIRWEEAVLFEAAQTQLNRGELSALGHDIAERIAEVPPPAIWS